MIRPIQIVVQNGQPKNGRVDQLRTTMKRFAASVNWIQCLMKTASCRKLLVYLQLQSAWTEKDWNSVRNLESTSLYEQHLTQLQEHIRAKTTNVLERVCVEDSKIKDFIENPEGNDRIEVILSSTMRDYIRNDETGRVIEGDPTKDLFTVYRMVFLP